MPFCLANSQHKDWRTKTVGQTANSPDNEQSVCAGEKPPTGGFVPTAAWLCSTRRFDSLLGLRFSTPHIRSSCVAISRGSSPDAVSWHIASFLQFPFSWCAIPKTENRL